VHQRIFLVTRLQNFKDAMRVGKKSALFADAKICLNSQLSKEIAVFFACTPTPSIKPSEEMG